MAQHRNHDSTKKQLQELEHGPERKWRKRITNWRWGFFIWFYVIGAIFALIGAFLGNDVLLGIGIVAIVLATFFEGFDNFVNYDGFVFTKTQTRRRLLPIHRLRDR